MSLKFQLIWAGRHSPEPWESLSADYRRRIEAFASARPVSQNEPPRSIP